MVRPWKPDDDRVQLKRTLIVIGASAALISIALFVRWACHSEFRQTRVSELRWTHRTNFRARHIYRDGDWGSPPGRGGYYHEPTWDHSCYSKYSHSSCTTINKATVCTPVYRTWCDYSYYDWPIEKFREHQGSGHDVSWLSYGPELDVDHRESHEAWYEVDFTNGRKTWTWPTRSKEQYDKFKTGDYWQLEFPNWGDMHPVKPLPLEGR